MTVTTDPKIVRGVLNMTPEQAVKELQELNEYVQKNRRLTTVQAAWILINYLDWMGVDAYQVAVTLKEIKKQKENQRRIA